MRLKEAEADIPSAASAQKGVPARANFSRVGDECGGDLRAAKVYGNYTHETGRIRLVVESRRRWRGRPPLASWTRLNDVFR